MARQLESDRILFGAVVVLVLFGALMVFSASAVMASERYGSSYYFLLRQILWAGVGLGAMVALMHFDYRRLSNPAVVFPALGLQFLLLVAVLFADRTHHAHRWLRLGPVSFQPSEFSKIVLVLFLAYFLHLRRTAVNDWKHTLLPIGLVAGVSVALVVKEPDFGTSVALVFIVAAMLFAVLAGVPLGVLSARWQGRPLDTAVRAGSIMGVGTVEAARGVRWVTARRIIWAWILTIPVSALISATVYLTLENFF